mgnify:CR=1 FL=1
MPMKRPCWRYVCYALAAVAVYVAVGLIARSIAQRMLFFDIPPSYVLGGELVTLTTEDGVRIVARDLPRPGASYTILYLHGNGSELGRDRAIHEGFARHGYSVLAIDYRGYGGSAGGTTEAGLYADARAALAYLREVRHVPADRVIVYGFSLGGGPATDLAAQAPVAGLVLQSTFTSAFAVESSLAATLLAPFDYFCNRAKLRRVACPVLLFHGTSDGVIPFAHGPALATAARTPVRTQWVDGAGHSDVPDLLGARYWTVLQEWVEGLGAAR